MDIYFNKVFRNVGKSDYVETYDPFSVVSIQRQRKLSEDYTVVSNTSTVSTSSCDSNDSIFSGRLIIVEEFKKIKEFQKKSEEESKLRKQFKYMPGYKEALPDFIKLILDDISIPLSQRNIFFDSFAKPYVSDNNFKISCINKFITFTQLKYTGIHKLPIGDKNYPILFLQQNYHNPNKLKT